jgi:hypothetical protein
VAGSLIQSFDQDEHIEIFPEYIPLFQDYIRFLLGIFGAILPSLFFQMSFWVILLPGRNNAGFSSLAVLYRKIFSRLK